jgi:ABC-type transporter Mla maintaining outer membrane lipid asymmetry ATPase subunit MlaF
MTPFVDSILKVACRQLIVAGNQREPLTLDSLLVREFVNAFNAQLIKVKQERDEFIAAMRDASNENS